MLGGSKKDLMDTLNNFHDEAFLDLGNNATFISLIPKSEGVNKISDFRPICLVGSIYKIIFKTLSCRLKEALKEVISSNQSAFLEGRQSVDGVLVVNECLDAVPKNGERGVLCKLDLEKAYDGVNWNFLDYMFRMMGFGNNGRDG